MCEIARISKVYAVESLIIRRNFQSSSKQGFFVPGIIFERELWVDPARQLSKNNCNSKIAQ